MVADKVKVRLVFTSISTVLWQVAVIAQSPISGVLKNAEGAVISYNYWNYLGPEVQEAVFIPNTAALNGIISSVDFRLAEYRESKFLLRIRLMKWDPASGNPGEDLLFSENLVKPGRFKRNFSLKLKETSIPLPPDGVFVTFEWIPVNNKVEKNERTPYILGNLNADKSYTFSNYKELGWHHHTGKSELTGKYRVPGFRITVLY